MRKIEKLVSLSVRLSLCWISILTMAVIVMGSDSDYRHFAIMITTLWRHSKPGNSPTFV